MSLGSERLGAAVAVSGQVLAAAAPGLEGAASVLRGGVLVWRRDAAGAWTLEATLRAPAAAAGTPSAFGAAVACSGDRIAVGNPLDVSPGGRVAGAVYLFHRDAASGDWSLEARLPNPGSGGDGEFGSAVAIEGDRVVAGPTTAGGDGPPRAAAYYARNFTTGEWTMRQLITPQGSLAPWGNGFAASIALAQGRVAIGAPLEQLAPGDYRGAVHVYQLDNTSTFQPLVRVDGPTPTSAQPFGDGFATSLAFDGGTLLVGAPRAVTNFVQTGAAYVFTQTNAPAAPWLPAASLRPTDPTQPGGFGVSVALSAGWAVVGSPQVQIRYEYGSFTGCAELFSRSGAGFSARGRRAAFRPGPTGGDKQRAVGTAVAISLNSTGEPFMVLGAPESQGGRDDAGAVDILPLLASITDCNRNALPDACEVAAGIAQDLNSNGVPDICCPADMDGNQQITLEDLFAFLAEYFAQRPRANINRVGGVTVQDVFDFIDSYVRGCL